MTAALVWLRRKFVRAGQCAYEPQIWHGPRFVGTEGQAPARRVDLTGQEAAMSLHALAQMYPAPPEPQE